MDRQLRRAILSRGMDIQHAEAGDQLITKNLRTSDSIDQFYNYLHRYSFRLFLRDLLEFQPILALTDLTRYCSPGAARRYLRNLQNLGIIRERDNERFELLVDFVPNFGETLEWYLSEILRREFEAPASYRVVLKNGGVGGDYDVLALINDKLLYVEVKSSPPKAVDNAQVKNFLSRIRDLLPDLAFFFEDTHLRMKDKIVRLFEEELARRYGRFAAENFPVVRLQDELFHINHCVYIVNSKRGTARNFRICIRDAVEFQLKQSGMPLSPRLTGETNGTKNSQN